MNCCRHDGEHQHGQSRLGGWRRFALFAAALAAPLAWNYRVALLAYLPYLLALLCPLMHVFMMRGHSHGERHENRTPTTDEVAPQPLLGQNRAEPHAGT